MRTLAAGRSGNKVKSVRAPPAQPIEVKNQSITEENSGGEDNHAPLNNSTVLPEITRKPRKIETESLKQSLKRMQLLNAKGEETRDALGNGKRSQIYESNHRRNTTLNKNPNYKSEADGTRNAKSNLLDASRALSTDAGPSDQEKVVAINEFLKQKLDVSKLNVRMFQSKIQRFQHKYGLNLIDGSSPTPAKAFKTIQASKHNPKLNVSSNPDLLDLGSISH